MCVLHAYDKNNDKSTDAKKIDGGIPLPSDSTINPLASLCVGINMLDTWINALENNFVYRCCV